MSEQQRVFLAVVACLCIFVTWQVAVIKTRPPAPVPVAGSQDHGTGATAQDGSAAVVQQQESSKGEGRVLGASSRTRPPKASPVTFHDFSTSRYRGTATSSQAALTRLELLGYTARGEDDEAASPVSLVAPAPESGSGPPQRQAWFTFGPDDAVSWESLEADGGRLDWVGRLPSRTEVRVRMAPQADAYGLDYLVSLASSREGAGQPGFPLSVHLLLDAGKVAAPGFFAAPIEPLRGLCESAAGIERRSPDELEDGPWRMDQARLAGLDLQYFVATVGAAKPGEGPAGRCEVGLQGQKLHVTMTYDVPALEAGQVWELPLTLFAGPKREADLVAVSPLLPEVIDYSIWGIPLGFMARPMVVLLSVFHGWTGSWGVAIMLLTLVVKLMLFPVTYKSVVSMRRMQLLKPEIDALKKRFEKDRERLQVEQMKLFRERGVNPLGGCLPMLLQMPVWFALYRTLWTAVDLYQQPFLWIPDLTVKEPLPFMALALGALTYLQQKLTPMAADAAQMKMMTIIMPIMLTVFMLPLPSGLVLYILVNSILTIVQQVAINKRQITV